jgi:hypothetical protein
MTTDNSITGAAGAYFVAAELSHLGWIASVTLGNAPRTDVLAQRAGSPEIVAAIQVKTRRAGDFQVGLKAEQPAPTAGNEWFVLVSLSGPGERPDFYVMPRTHLSALTYVAYRAWLGSPGRGGQPRRGTSMRALGTSEVEGYHEAWDDLKRPIETVAPRLPDWYYPAQEDLLDDRPHLPRP